MAYTMLSALTTKNDRWTIKVKVIRLWDSINPSSNELMSTDMILLDEEGNAIHGSIGKQLSRNFKPKIKEKSIYILKNIKVQEYTKYRPLKNDLKINFLYNTTVKEVKKDSLDFLDFYFEFADTHTLTSRKENDEQLSDVIGLLSQIYPVNQRLVNKNTSKERISNIREIEILLLDGEKIKITLWGDILAKLLDEGIVGKQTVIIVTSNTVRHYYGLSLRTTSATKIYMDLQIPETLDIINRYQDKSVLPKMMDVDKSIQGPIEQQMFYNRRTLREIMELRYNDVKKKEIICTTKAKVDDINKDNGWWYMACKSCWHATIKESNSYICKTCGKESENAEPRYIINLKISDHTGTTCTIFDEEAKRLFNNSVSSILDKQNGDTRTIPDTIQLICGKTLIFRFKLDSRNLKECREDYKVNYTFVPNEKLEIEYLNEQAEEGLLNNQGEHNYEKRNLEESENEEKHDSDSSRETRSFMLSCAKKEPNDDNNDENEKRSSLTDDSKKLLKKRQISRRDKERSTVKTKLRKVTHGKKRKVKREKLGIEYLNEQADEGLLNNQGEHNYEKSNMEKSENEEKHDSDSSKETRSFMISCAKKEPNDDNNDENEKRSSLTDDSKKLLKKRQISRRAKERSTVKTKLRKVTHGKKRKVKREIKISDNEQEYYSDTSSRKKDCVTKIVISDDEEELSTNLEDRKDDNDGSITTNENEETFIYDDSQKKCKLKGSTNVARRKKRKAVIKDVENDRNIPSKKKRAVKEKGFSDDKVVLGTNSEELKDDINDNRTSNESPIIIDSDLEEECNRKGTTCKEKKGCINRKVFSRKKIKVVTKTDISNNEEKRSTESTEVTNDNNVSVTPNKHEGKSSPSIDLKTGKKTTRKTKEESIDFRNKGNEEPVEKDEQFNEARPKRIRKTPMKYT